jgi:hypothetical protein
MLEQFSSAWEPRHGSCALGLEGAIGTKAHALHYIVVGAALLLSAGIGVAVASQIVVALG